LVTKRSASDRSPSKTAGSWPIALSPWGVFPLIMAPPGFPPGFPSGFPPGSPPGVGVRWIVLECPWGCMVLRHNSPRLVRSGFGYSTLLVGVQRLLATSVGSLEWDEVISPSLCWQRLSG
jgi:hypothetical protein